MSFPNVIFGTPGMQFAQRTAAQGQGVNAMGTSMRFADGRMFRWTKAGAAALVLADIQQAAIAITNHNLQTLTTAAVVGDGSVTMTIGNTAVAADFYKDGYLTCDPGTAAGSIYTIKSHLAALGSATTFVVPLVETVQVAIPTTANTVSLIQNLYQNVIQSVVTTPTAKLVGVAVKAQALSSFGFLATRGPAMVNCISAMIIGEKAIGGSSTAGAAAPESAFSLFETIGTVIRVGTTATFAACINLNMDA